MTAPTLDILFWENAIIREALPARRKFKHSFINKHTNEPQQTHSNLTFNQTMWLHLLKGSIIWMLLLAIEALADKNNDTPSNAHLRGRELAVGVVSPTGTQQYRLNKGKAQWYKVQSNQHYYRYNFQQDCNTCANHNYPWRVKLQGGQPPVAVDTLGNRHSGALSIAGMFAKLQKDIVDPNIKSVDADYDEEIGYPARFTIEYDDGFVITSKVFNFQFEKDSAQDQLTEHKKTWESQHIRDYDFTYFEEGKRPVLIFACLCLSFEKTNSLS